MSAAVEQVEPDVFAAYEQDVSKLKLIGDRYLCEHVEIRSKSAGGVYIAGNDERLTGWRVGRVRVVGNGHRLESPNIPVVLSDSLGNSWAQHETVFVPMFHEVGDLIMMEALGGRDLLIRGRKYILINQTNTFGVWEA